MKHSLQINVSSCCFQFRLAEVVRLGLRLISCPLDADDSIRRCSAQEHSSELLHHPRPDEATGRTDSVARSQRV